MKPARAALRRTISALSALIVLALVSVGCSAAQHRSTPPEPSASPARYLYVAVGASESVGVGASDPLRDAWTQVFYRSALPASAGFINVAVPGSTVVAGAGRSGAPRGQPGSRAGDGVAQCERPGTQRQSGKL